MKLLSVFKRAGHLLVVIVIASALIACSDSESTPEATVSASATTTASANSKMVTTTLDTAIAITIEARSDAGPGQSFRILEQPADGVLVGTLSGEAVTVTYTPNPGFFGDDTFDFEVTDIDGNTATGTVTVRVLEQSDPQADADGDGLRDLDELNLYGTNPRLADTDGDGFSDFGEIVDLGFNPQVNNYRFNPLIADTPEIDVRIASVPDIRINYTLTDGTSKTVGTSRSQSSSTAVSTTVSESESTTVSESQSASVEISTSVSVSAEVGLFSPPKAETEASVTSTAGYSYEKTTTNEQTSSWSETQTQENTETFEQSESFEQNNSVSASNGEISIAVDVVNRGHISFTLQNLFLSATYIRPRGVDPLVPIGNLAFDASSGSFPSVTLSPGQSTGTLVFKGEHVNLEKVKEILSDSRGFSVRPTLYTLLDQDDTAYNFASTAIISNSAMIMVDYNGNNGLDNVTKMVAVNGVPGQQISMLDALNMVLKLDAQTTTDGNGNTYINSVNGLGNADPDALWLILHTRQMGNNSTDVLIYTTPEDRQNWEGRNPNVKNLVSDYDPANITLGAGDVVHLVYLQDSDLDGLSNRMEFFYRSDPNDADSDDDGLADGVEAKDGWTVAYEDSFGANVLRKVYSDPIKADTDLDGRSDFDEANLTATDDALRQDPRRFDTDGDGLDDLIDDFDTTQNPTVKSLNQYDDMTIRNVSTDAVVDNSGGPYDVNVSYDLPAILADATSNGITEYIVVSLRYNDTSGQGEFPPPEPLKDSFTYLVGDTVPCANGEPGCLWSVVDVYPATLDQAGTQQTFTDSSLLNPEVPGTSPADVAKYVFDVGVNGRYTRMNFDRLATAQTETLEIHMISGEFRDVRTVFSTSTTTANRNAAMTSVFDWMNGGEPVYFDYRNDAGNGQGAYAAYDGRSGGIGGLIGDNYALPYSLMRPGDGKLDISWYLYVGGNRINDPATYPVSLSYSPDWFEDINNAPVNLPAAIDKNGSADLDMFVSGYATTPPATDSDGKAVFTVTVPAVPGNHWVELFIKEYDYARSEYNEFVSPSTALYGSGANPTQGHDGIVLRRDDQGVWTASVLPINDNQIDEGVFPGGANITRQGNVNPIRYRTRTIRLSDKAKPGSTSMQMEFNAEFHIYVR